MPWETEPKKILLWLMSESVLPVSSSTSFIVSSLPFTSLIHFEFIFICGMKKRSNFIPLHAASSFPSSTYWRDGLSLSQHHLLKRPFFPHWMILAPLLKISCPQMCGFISGLTILFHRHVSYASASVLFTGVSY